MTKMMAIMLSLITVMLMNLYISPSMARAQESGEDSLTQGTGDTNLLNPGDCCLNHLAPQNGAPTKSQAAKLKQVESYSGGEKAGRPASGTPATGVREDSDD